MHSCRRPPSSLRSFLAFTSSILASTGSILAFTGSILASTGSILAFTGSMAVAGCGAHLGPESECAVPLGSSPVRGPADAWVTVVEFGDFQCPACGQAEPILREVDGQRSGKIRWVFKHLPLSFHERAVPAAIAAECAHDQGLFWPMHDLIYAHPEALGDAGLAARASEIGLDMTTWTNCLDTDPPRQRIAADLRLADEAHVDATPTFFINGSPVVGALPAEEFLPAIDNAQTRAQSSGVTAADYYHVIEQNGCR